MKTKEDRYFKTEWLEDIEDKYASGVSNFFLVTGNIGDYPIPGYLFNEYLNDSLIKMGMDKIYEYEPGIKQNQNTNSENVQSLYSIDNSFFSGIIDNIEKKAFIIYRPEYILPNLSDSEIINSGISDRLSTMLSTVQSKEFYKGNNILIIVTESKYSVHKSLLGANTRIHSVEVEYPRDSIRLKFAEYLKETSNTEIKTEIEIENFANLTAGLTLIGMEDIYLQAEHTGVLKREFITSRKKELIKREYGDVIEIMDSDGYSFDDYAGQEHLKKYHRDVIINPILTGFTDIVPKGVLYTGPPGTGKTHFARCLSGEAGINFVEFKISKILGKWVGESEKNFEKALTCFKSIAPVGVFIDELDQAFSRGDGESNSVNKNIFGMFLTVLSDSKYRGKIIWIGAANYPNKIDEALKRTGRFDKKMPFLPPEQNERIESFKIHLGKTSLSVNLSDEEYEVLGKKTDGYTHAEIEGIVIKSWELALRKQRSEILYEDLLSAIGFMVISTSSKIKEMTEIAINECNDLEFMPEKYRKTKGSIQ